MTNPIDTPENRAQAWLNRTGAEHLGITGLPEMDEEYKAVMRLLSERGWCETSYVLEERAARIQCRERQLRDALDDLQAMTIRALAAEAQLELMTEAAWRLGQWKQRNEPLEAVAGQMNEALKIAVIVLEKFPEGSHAIAAYESLHPQPSDKIEQLPE